MREFHSKEVIEQINTRIEKTDLEKISETLGNEIFQMSTKKFAMRWISELKVTYSEISRQAKASADFRGNSIGLSYFDLRELKNMFTNFSKSKPWV